MTKNNILTINVLIFIRTAINNQQVRINSSTSKTGQVLYKHRMKLFRRVFTGLNAMSVVIMSFTVEEINPGDGNDNDAGKKHRTALPQNRPNSYNKQTDTVYDKI